MIKNITAAYVLLIGIFGVILMVGSVKSTFFPDEKVYTPGKIVTVYSAESRSFTQFYPNQNTPFSTQNFQANSFGQTSLTNCLQP